MSATGPLLELRDVDVNYGAVEALRGVSLHVEAGEFVVLLGANGAGKSTTLRTISGLLKPRRGSVVLFGRPIQGIPAHRITELGVAHVPEGRQVFPDLTVRENLQLGGYPWRKHRDVLQETLEHVLGVFPRLGERLSQAAGTLSGGEQQMLSLGRALMAKPRLLMLDEPSLGLAPIIVGEMFELLARLHREQQLTVLLVEQQAALALRVAERGYVLENGRVVLNGTRAQLTADARVQQVYLGGEAGVPH